MNRSADPRRALRAGISLVESLVATTLTVITGSAILAALGSAVQSSNRALEETVALGMAQGLIDEVAGTLYGAPGAGPRQWPLTPDSGEGPQRSSYDDNDDFATYRAAPAVDSWNVESGQGDGSGGLRHVNFRGPSEFFDNWRQEIDVYYVSDSDPSQALSTGQTSYHRAVEARIYIASPDGSTRQVAQLRRVFSYVPTP